MNDRSIRRMLVLSVTFAAMLRPLGGAADEPATQPAENGIERLADRQGQVLTRLTRLEDRLFRLSEALKRTEPDHAARLLDALSTSRNMLLRQRVEQIVGELRAARLSDAADRQQQLVADLNKLLALLLDEKRDDAERKQEMDALKALRERLDALLKEQQEELAAAQKAAELQRKIGDLAQARDRVRGLLGKQRDVSAATKAAESSNSAEAGKLAEPQKQVGQETESLSKELGEIPEEKGATESAEALQRAAEAMQQAGKSLEQGDAGQAGAPQAEAERQLDEAANKLERRIAELEKESDFAKQAQAQQDTAGKTDELAKKMGEQPSESGSPSDGGESPEGQPQEGQPSDKPPGEAESAPKPGGQQVKEAVPHQRQAAKELEKKDARKAEAAQKKAIDKLQQAKDELESALEQLRKEQQEELLAALESRIGAMLARQIEVNKETNRLDGVGRDQWSRSDQLSLVETTKGQNWVSEEAATALKIVREDGTTIVVPQIMEQVRDDARSAGERLGAADTGDGVRQVQEAIVAALQDLLDAVRELQKKNEQSEGGQPGGDSDRNPPLLPGSAELKLLRSWQVRINQQTKDIEQQRVLPSGSAEGLAERIDKLAKRQASVAEMARDLAEGEQSRREGAQK